MKYYEGVAQRVRKLEEKNGIIYAKPDGSLYNTLKWIYILVFIYGNFNTLAYLLGMTIIHSNNLNEFSLEISTAAICLVLMIIGLVLILKKVHIIGTALNVLPAVVLIFFFKYGLTESDGVVYLKYYWRHLAPMVIIALMTIWLAIIAIRANLKFKKGYIKVTENLYNLYKVNVSTGEELEEEQWTEFLQKYDPFNYKPEFVAVEKKEENSEG